MKYFWLDIFLCKLFVCTSLCWLYKSLFKLYCIVVLCHCCMTIPIYNPTLSICTYESSPSHWYVCSECRPVPSMQACSDRASTILEGEQNNWRDRRFPEEPLWQTTRHCHCTGTNFSLLILWSAVFMQIYLLQIQVCYWGEVQNWCFFSFYFIVYLGITLQGFQNCTIIFHCCSLWIAVFFTRHDKRLWISLLWLLWFNIFKHSLGACD